MKTALFSILLLLLVAPLAQPGAQLLPDGFAIEQIVKGPFTGQPVGFDILADGRILFIELQGNVRIAPVGAYPIAGDSIHSFPDVLVETERGLLGVAGDPDWPDEPYFYFYYSGTDSASHIVRFTVTGIGVNLPTSTALTLTERYEILTIPDFDGSHNGGTIRFGPDENLYVSNGDDKDICSAQDRSSWNGSILRLDLDDLPSAGPGGPPPIADITPDDNPFIGHVDQTAHLIWAFGLRNPFRFTIDAVTNDVFVGDVGSNTWEEANRVPFDSAGTNFGWPWFEGPDPNNFCDSATAFTPPFHVFPHMEPFPAIITGGPVYRDVIASDLRFGPAYDGDYFFIEPNLQWIGRVKNTGGTWSVPPPVPGQPDSTKWADQIGGYATDMQLGADGAIYMMYLSTGTLSRGIHRIVSDYTATSIDPGRPLSLMRSSAHPNPAPAEGTTIQYRLPSDAAVDLAIYDVRGRLVRTLRAGRATNGSLHWDGRAESGRSVASGLYYYTITAPNGVRSTGKISLVR